LNDEGSKSAKTFAALFCGTLILYITIYGGCTAVRQRGGPWVMFQDRAADGTPVVRIEHHKLLAAGGITFTFPGERAPDRFTNAPLTIIFKTPNTNALPFGPVEFVDTTFLPGTIAVDVFGHLIEAVPRTLYLDGREIPWTPGTNIVVPPTGKLPPDQRPKRKPAR
jgi:hypothetical protein